MKNRTKIKIYNSIVESTLIYGSGTLKMTKGERQTRNGLHAKSLQVISVNYCRNGFYIRCRVSRMDYIRNTEIRDIIGKIETIVEEI